MSLLSALHDRSTADFLSHNILELLFVIGGIFLLFNIKLFPYFHGQLYFLSS